MSAVEILFVGGSALGVLLLLWFEPHAHARRQIMRFRRAIRWVYFGRGASGVRREARKIWQYEEYMTPFERETIAELADHPTQEDGEHG